MKKLDKTNNSNNLSYQEDGTPYCENFNDIYFDRESGYLQSDFVFIQKNQIFSRMQAAKKTFTIAETGFGTGLNFLLTLQAYQKAQQNLSVTLAPLHFISVEKYPLTKEQLVQSLSLFPQLQPLTLALTDSYPECPIEEFPQDLKTSFLNGQVNLTLIFEDATHGFSSLRAEKDGLVDAWYLDGFSPAKNPDMWSKELFSQIGRLSKEQSTLTTFCLLYTSPSPRD